MKCEWLDKLPWRIKIKEKNDKFFKEHGSEPTWKEYQELHNFKETDYSVKEREWKMLDYGNPAWVPAIAFGGRN
jgi:hypothetical protein